MIEPITSFPALHNGMLDLDSALVLRWSPCIVFIQDRIVVSVGAAGHGRPGGNDRSRLRNLICGRARRRSNKSVGVSRSAEPAANATRSSRTASFALPVTGGQRSPS